MSKKYKTLKIREKIFVWLSVLIPSLMIGVYLLNVTSALSMDKTSYNCTGDSMMMQICHDPFGSSIAWTVVYALFFGWPLLLAWLSVGLFIFVPKLRKKVTP